MSTASYIFRNSKDLMSRCEEHKMPIWEVMLRYEMQLSNKDKNHVYEMLKGRLKVIFDGIDATINIPEMSPSGMAGKSAPSLVKALKNFKEWEPKLLLNETAVKAMLGAVATGENNARMGVILAFPTAGAAGVLPGVMFAARDRFGLTDDQLVQMMLTASAIGIIIANTATLSGAAGGCQAEVGTAT
ncbi:MAG: L-serine ammonia-lyase, iron-sulfur-dependent, subunit alpha, partial [Patescibacteria group bacterium]